MTSSTPTATAFQYSPAQLIVEVCSEWNNGSRPNLEAIDRLLGHVDLKYSVDLTKTSRIAAIEKEWNNGDSPNMPAVNELLLGYVDGPSPWWTDLSTSDQPSWALKAQEILSGCQLENVEGKWMTVAEAQFVQFKRARKFVLQRRGPFPLMSLPFELRQRTFELLVDQDPIRAFVGGQWAVPMPVSHSMIACGNSQLRKEVLLAALQDATWEIQSGAANCAFRAWLGQLDVASMDSSGARTAFEYVRTLSFPHFSRFPHQSLALTASNLDTELMRLCANLRVIKLHFVVYELFNQWYPPTEKDVYQLRDEYRLDGIRGLPQLDLVRLRGLSSGTPGHAVLEKLANWIRTVYAIDLRIVQVEIEA